MFDINTEDKNWSSDRILVLKVIDNKKPLSTLGAIDSRLFKEENSLHAHMDKQSCLWFLRYEKGHLPPVLLGKKFTRFNDLLAFAKNYFNSRNVDIVEVKNAENS